MTPSDRSRSLGEWLRWREEKLSQAIEPGLGRVRVAATALGLNPPRPLFTVAGTNGKGSTCAFLESLLRAHGLSTGVYGSPHLLEFRERIRVDGAVIEPLLLTKAFARLAGTPEVLALSVFEFDTLLAVQCFELAAVDSVILETGMGGRLDAVNVFDADVALVTSVDLDHQRWLGDNREAIAREKAGIFRKDRPALCADPDVPDSLREYARSIAARLEGLDENFRIESSGERWFVVDGERVGPLVDGALGGGVQRRNAALAVAAMRRAGLERDNAKVHGALRDTTLPGRFQRLEGAAETYVDVAHNPAATKALAERLRALPERSPCVAVFGAYRDKDIAGMVGNLDGQVDQWILCGLPGPRGASAAFLAECLGSVACAAHSCENVADGYRLARRIAGQVGRIVIFGSFETVAAALRESGSSPGHHPSSG